MCFLARKELFQEQFNILGIFALWRELDANPSHSHVCVLNTKLQPAECYLSVVKYGRKPSASLKCTVSFILICEGGVTIPWDSLLGKQTYDPSLASHRNRQG